MTFKSKGFLGGCVIDVDLHEFTIVSFVQSWILTWATLCHMHLRFDPFCDYLKTFKVLFFLKFFLSCDWGICFNHDLEVLHCHVQWICHSIMGFGLLWAQTSTLIMSLVNSQFNCEMLWSMMSSLFSHEFEVYYCDSISIMVSRFFYHEIVVMR